MAYESPMTCINVVASADLSASQFRGVSIGTTGLATAGSAGDPVIGILQDKPTALGHVGTVCVFGVSKIELGGTLAVGARFAFDADGKAIAFTGSNFDYVIGGFVLVGGDSGNIGTVLFTGGAGGSNLSSPT